MLSIRSGAMLSACPLDLIEDVIAPNVTLGVSY